VGNTFRIAQGFPFGATRIQPEAAPSTPASKPPAALDSPLGLNIAPRRPQGAAEQFSPLRSRLPQPQAGVAQASFTPLAAASPPPPPALLHLLPTPRLHGEIRALSPEANQLQRPQETQPPQQARGPTLAELFAQERQQEQAERAQQAQRAQLLHSALPNGGGVMKRLMDRAARQHPTTMAQMWHARTTGAPKPMEGQRRQDFEVLVHADVMALVKTGRMHPMKAIHTMRTAVVDGTWGQGIMAQDQRLLLDVLDVQAKLASADHLYKQANLKETSDTNPAFIDAKLLEKPKVLGSGAFNTVFAVKLQNPDGSVFDGVFKPLNATEDGGVAKASGIPKDDPQTAMRNLATVAYAKKLGLDVIADTRVTLIDTGRGPLDLDLGLIMERARGKPASKVDASILARADVSAEITKLQLLDHLTGQGDRHSNNYFINIEPNGRAKVTGIDNDQSFGKDLTHPADIQWGDDPRYDDFRGTALPPVVDTEMERSINALTKEDIRSMLGNKLSEAEIAAAVSRHQGVKDHIAQLRADNKIIDPAQWGHPKVQQLLNWENSYVGRELDAINNDSW
jgi:hypothetical protein